jgi:uncharacterized protein YjdB
MEGIELVTRKIVVGCIMVAGLVGCSEDVLTTRPEVIHAESIAPLVVTTDLLVMHEGERQTIRVKGQEHPRETMSWTSGAPEVATVSATGEISAFTVGTATVTASIDGASTDILVTVLPSTPEETSRATKR